MSPKSLSWKNCNLPANKSAWRGNAGKRRLPWQPTELSSPHSPSRVRKKTFPEPIRTLRREVLRGVAKYSFEFGRNGYENIRRFFCQRILKTVPTANFRASVLKCGPEPTLQHLRLVFSRPSPSPIHHRRGCRRRCSVPARS